MRAMPEPDDEAMPGEAADAADLPGGEEELMEEFLDLDCPECGDVEEHIVVRAAKSGWTVACTVCHTVRTLPAPKQERQTTVPTILADGATSQSVHLDVPLDGAVAIDDEFQWEGSRVRVTAVEKRDGTRPKKAPGRDIKVLYAVRFDTVTLNYTLNQGEVTRSVSEAVEPEVEIHVGSVREVQGVRLVVKTLKSDQNRTLHRGYLLARNIRRVFADVAGGKARVGERVPTRERGAGPWGSKAPTSRVKRPRSGVGGRGH